MIKIAIFLLMLTLVFTKKAGKFSFHFNRCCKIPCPDSLSSLFLHQIKSFFKTRGKLLYIAGTKTISLQDLVPYCKKGYSWDNTFYSIGSKSLKEDCLRLKNRGLH